MISALMEFANTLSARQRDGSWRTQTFHQALETFLILLAPTAPHIAEELWQLTGHPGSVHQQAWPAWDARLAQDEIVQIAVQVDSRVRAVIQFPAGASQAEIQQQALDEPKVKQHLEGKSIQQIVFVPGRILNVVTSKS
jgi:leucyl-tRNA synthetase